MCAATTRHAKTAKPSVFGELFVIRKTVSVYIPVVISISWNNSHVPRKCFEAQAGFLNNGYGHLPRFAGMDIPYGSRFTSMSACSNLTLIAVFNGCNMICFHLPFC
jgi:hypothetical protein